MDIKQLTPDISARRLSVREVRDPRELNYFEEIGSSYLAGKVDRSERSEGLPHFWHTIARHKFAILAASLVGSLLGFLAGIPLKPVFRASTTLEVLNVNEDFMNMKLTQATVPGTDSDDLSEEETQATLLQSQELLDRVSAKLNPDPTTSRPTIGWRKWLGLSGGSRLSAREKLLNSAMQSLKVTNFPRTRILNVSVDSTSPQLALDFTNTLVQEFIKQNIDARWASTQQTGDWLSHEINDARSRLQDSEAALQAYASSSGLFFIDDQKQTNVATEKLQGIQQQLSAATADRITKQSVFELARKSPPDTLADVLNDPSLQSLSARLDEATRQVASLSAVYNPGYAKLQEAQAEVASLRTAFTNHRADLLERIQTDYQGAARREQLLADTYDAQAKEVAGQDERAVKYNVLKREVDSNQQLYDTMLQQMKQASIATALHASNVHVVYPAYLLNQPVFPNLKMNAGLGLFFGLLGSVGCFMIREQRDQTLRQPGDLKQWARVQELGTIPHIQKNRYTRELLPVGVGKQKYPNHGKCSQAPVPYNLLNLSNISSWPIAVPEAFHSTLTSILLASESRKCGNVLVFTSPGPGDGKTIVVSNIAIAAAVIGKKVLLVDANLRRPRIHDLFGLKNEGMAELLHSEQPPARWPELTQGTRVTGLSVVTAGIPKTSAAILLNSPSFTTLLALWRQQFDLILLDTPPALSITDARVIGIVADGVVIVARARQTTRDAFQSIQERLAVDHIKLLGCILNDWDSDHTRHAYPYYYGSEVATFAEYPG